VTRSEICDKFIDSLEFELYPFQEEALLTWFESDQGMMLCAPTGMGKTLIAEAALFEALHAGHRLYYTTPLVALTDQKYREFQELVERWGFPRSEVGLITGNRKENPDARIRVVVAEILLNHLLSEEDQLEGVGGVVVDEFHYFNDWDRGIVWELTLVLMPKAIRLMLLSATVGNPAEFIHWLSKEHGRKLRLVQSDERKVPLDFEWVGEKLLTEHLPGMVSDDDDENRTPALVFCFNRDACWEAAEKLKGLKLIDQAAREKVEELIDAEDFKDGIGPKLRQMLICGVGVHHAGVLPKHKQAVEKLFLKKLIPFVVCTETLAAGINLPARSVVIHKLLKGKPGEEKLIPPSAAHQMFGRAGRPQFDSRGYVYALAHEDDVKIAKWRKKYEQIDPNSKDPGIMRARKDLERKKPSRRRTERYWAEGQLKTLIEAGPAKLFSHSMIPYSVLIYLLRRSGTLKEAREFLAKRFNTPDRIEGFSKQLERMVDNLAVFGFLTRSEDGEHLTLDERIHDLVTFRSIDPLYGAFLSQELAKADVAEKILAIESVLPFPPAIQRPVRPSEDLEPGPLQSQVIEPRLIQMGILGSGVESAEEKEADGERDYWAEEQEDDQPRTLADMLKALFDAKLETPEDVFVQPKRVLGGILDAGGDFFKFTKAHNLAKNEGLILRHLLRLVILADEFSTRSGGDPDYATIGEQATEVCQQVDPRYTDRFLAAEAEAKEVGGL